MLQQARQRTLVIFASLAALAMLAAGPLAGTSHAVMPSLETQLAAQETDAYWNCQYEGLTNFAWPPPFLAGCAKGAVDSLDFTRDQDAPNYAKPFQEAARNVW